MSPYLQNPVVSSSIYKPKRYRRDIEGVSKGYRRDTYCLLRVIGNIDTNGEVPAKLLKSFPKRKAFVGGFEQMTEIYKY
jgi:hypothetical protein